jgi:hypothetical protein
MVIVRDRMGSMVDDARISAKFTLSFLSDALFLEGR